MSLSTSGLDRAPTLFRDFDPIDLYFWKAESNTSHAEDKSHEYGMAGEMRTSERRL
jgi:hypothetical protein